MSNSRFYGGFLDGLHDGKFLSRVNSLTSLAEILVEEIIVECPNLSGKIFISYQNLSIALGRYFNDVDHYKARHNIDLIRTSKIIAHTIKWVSLYPVLFSSVRLEQAGSLSDKERGVLYNVNYYYIYAIIDYFINTTGVDISEQTYNRIYNDLTYYLKTGNYNERMASLWFEQIIN
jgi:hypothetical protein